MAFMYSFNGSFPTTPNMLNATNVSNDSHAAVGKQVTLSGSVIVDPLLPQLLALADAQAVGVVASGCVNNENRGFVYAGSGVFDADRAGESFTLAQLKAFASAGSPITFTAVREGTQTRIGIDANDDGVLDGASGITPLRACTSGTVKNLLVNGSFENNSAPPGGWAQAAIPGWTGSSLSISAGAAQDWWEVDLGSQNVIQTVNLFNRTDCCSTRLNNFYVLISATPMDGQTLAQLLANPAVTQRYVATTGFVAGNSPQEFSGAGGVQGRYVRVALAGTNDLQLAEVEVMGWPVGAN